MYRIGSKVRYGGDDIRFKRGEIYIIENISNRNYRGHIFENYYVELLYHTGFHPAEDFISLSEERKNKLIKIKKSI